MKKLTRFLLIILTAMMVTACGGGGSKKDERSLSDFINAYTDDGIEIDAEKKPIFQMIDAKDGVMFYIDNNVVKIYEYESEKTLEQAQKDYADIIKDWPVNGKFLLETSNDKAKEIFDGIE